MKVLITDRYAPETATRLSQELKCEVTFSKSLQPCAEELKNCQALLTRSRTRIDSELYQLAPQLKLVVSATAGYDHIDFANKPQNIIVAHTPEAHTQTVAELTLLFLLALSRNFDGAKKASQSRSWRDALPLAHEIYEKDLGLLGLGRIGQSVALKAKAFGMKVSAYDPYQPDAVFNNLGVQRLGLNELFANSDFLSLHAPLTRETRHIINSSTIELMSSDIQIINTARGALINESEFVTALETHQVKGAALDVFEKEPLKTDSRLHSMPQVITTPHIGAHTEEALKRASQAAYSRVKEFLEQGHCQSQLPPATDWAQFLIKSP